MEEKSVIVKDIEIPEGYEVDEENSRLLHVVFKEKTEKKG